MLLLRSRRHWAMLPLVALLLGGCVSTVPTLTASPGISLPIEGPTGTLPTIAPGATATVAPLDTATPASTLPPTLAPTLAPTVPPTEAPTENPHPNWPPGAISAGKSNEHVGETATVCGNVNTVRWLYSEPGHPTWININRPYPNMKFNAVIWGEQRREWSLNNKPEVMYAGKQICVTGVIETYNGWYQIQDLHKADIIIV
jgi:hypothetical protein